MLWFSSILASKFLWLLEQERSIIRVYVLCKQNKTSEEHKQHLQCNLEIWEIGITNIREQYSNKRRLKSSCFVCFDYEKFQSGQRFCDQNVLLLRTEFILKFQDEKKLTFNLKKKWKLIFQPRVWSPSCQVSKTANQLPITKKHNEVSASWKSPVCVCLRIIILHHSNKIYVI